MVSHWYVSPEDRQSFEQKKVSANAANTRYYLGTNFARKYDGAPDADCLYEHIIFLLGDNPIVITRGTKLDPNKEKSSGSDSSTLSFVTQSASYDLVDTGITDSLNIGDTIKVHTNYEDNTQPTMFETPWNEDNCVVVFPTDKTPQYLTEAGVAVNTIALAGGMDYTLMYLGEDDGTDVWLVLNPNGVEKKGLELVNGATLTDTQKLAIYRYLAERNATGERVPNSLGIDYVTYHSETIDDGVSTKIVVKYIDSNIKEDHIESRTVDGNTFFVNEQVDVNLKDIADIKEAAESNKQEVNVAKSNITTLQTAVTGLQESINSLEENGGKTFLGEVNSVNDLPTDKAYKGLFRVRYKGVTVLNPSSIKTGTVSSTWYNNPFAGSIEDTYYVDAIIASYEIQQSAKYLKIKCPTTDNITNAFFVVDSSNNNVPEHNWKLCDVVENNGNELVFDVKECTNCIIVCLAGDHLKDIELITYAGLDMRCYVNTEYVEILGKRYYDGDTVKSYYMDESHNEDYDHPYKVSMKYCEANAELDTDAGVYAVIKDEIENTEHLYIWSNDNGNLSLTEINNYESGELVDYGWIPVEEDEASAVGIEAPTFIVDSNKTLYDWLRNAGNGTTRDYSVVYIAPGVYTGDYTRSNITDNGAIITRKVYGAGVDRSVLKGVSLRDIDNIHDLTFVNGNFYKCNNIHDVKIAYPSTDSNWTSLAVGTVSHNYDVVNPSSGSQIIARPATTYIPTFDMCNNIKDVEIISDMGCDVDIAYGCSNIFNLHKFISQGFSNYDTYTVKMTARGDISNNFFMYYGGYDEGNAKGGYAAFFACTNLSNINVESNVCNCEHGVLYKCNTISDSYIASRISNEAAINKCNTITNTVVFGSISYINDENENPNHNIVKAVDDCSGLVNCYVSTHNYDDTDAKSIIGTGSTNVLGCTFDVDTTGNNPYESIITSQPVNGSIVVQNGQGHRVIDLRDYEGDDAIDIRFISSCLYETVIYYKGDMTLSIVPVSPLTMEDLCFVNEEPELDEDGEYILSIQNNTLVYGTLTRGVTPVVEEEEEEE